MADGLVTIAIEMDDGSVAKGVANLNQQLDQTGNGFKNAFSIGALGGLAYQGVMMVVDGVKQLAGEAISSSDAMEKFSSTMTFGGKTKQEVDTAKVAVQQYADKTVYDLNTVANTTAQLAANGVKDYTGLTEAAGNLNAVAGGNADTFGSVAMALTQTVGAGKLTTENWNQLADAIPGASGKLQQAMLDAGAYSGDFREAMANGEISAQEFQDAVMKLGMTDAAKEAASSTATIEGSIGNLQANVVGGLTGFINQFKGQITGGINGVATFAQDAFNALGNAVNYVLQNSGGIQAFFGAFSGGVFGVDTLNSAVQILGDVAKTAFDAFNTGAQFLADNEEIVKTLSVTILAGVAAYKAWQGALTAWQGALTAWQNITKIATVVQTAFNAVMSANPFMLIVVAITALVAGLTYFFTQTEAGKVLWQSFVATFYMTLDYLTTFFSETWTAISETAISIWNSITSTISGIWQGLTTWISTTLTAFGTFFSTLWTNISNSVRTIWATLVSAVLGIITSFVTFIRTNFTRLGTALSLIWTGIQQVASGAWEMLKNIVLAPVLLLIQLVTGDFNGMGNTISGVWNNIQNAANSIWNGIKNIFTGIVSGIVATVTGYFNSLSAIVGGIWNGIAGLASSIWNGISSVVTGLANGAVNGVRNIWNAIPGWFAGIWNGITGLASSIWGGISSTVTGLASGAVDGLKSVWGGITGWVSDTFNGIKRAITSALDIDLASVGRNILDGLINGIEGAVDSVVNAAKNVAKSIKNKIKETLGIHSPSRVMRDEIGKFIPQGLAIGIDQTAGDVENSMQKLSNIVTSIQPEATVSINGAEAGTYKAKKIMDAQLAGQATTGQQTGKAEVHFDNTYYVQDTPSEREIERRTRQQLQDMAYG